ncbi:hypothetical protein AB0Q93_36800, partial [Streptomyces sp. NPDC088184]
MARHAFSKSRRRALLRAGLTVTAVGAALGAGGAAAQAAPLPHVPVVGADPRSVPLHHRGDQHRDRRT